MAHKHLTTSAFWSSTLTKNHLYIFQIGASATVTAWSTSCVILLSGATHLFWNNYFSRAYAIAHSKSEGLNKEHSFHTFFFEQTEMFSDLVYHCK